MRAPKCRTCGLEHWGSVCAQVEPAKKSTAARKDVRALEVSVPRSRKATATLSGSIPDAAKANDVAPPAGTQALPVDAKIVVAHDDRVRDLPAASLAKIAEAQAKRGRPRIHNDRKAYKAQKQREYRQRKAAEKEAKP